MGGEKCAAAIKLKIKVASVNVRLHKKLHTAVFPDIALKTGMDRAHVLIFHTENAINIPVIIQQFTQCSGLMRAPFRPAAIHGERRSMTPDGALPYPLHFGKLAGK
jgi:hypothetical protein